LIIINLKKRGTTQKGNYYPTKSIVYDYYLKGQTLFKEKLNNTL